MEEPLNITKLRQQFPVTARYAYLNHASVGGLSQPVVGAMTRRTSRPSMTLHTPLKSFTDTCTGHIYIITGLKNIGIDTLSNFVLVIVCRLELANDAKWFTPYLLE